MDYNELYRPLKNISKILLKAKTNKNDKNELKLK